MNHIMSACLLLAMPHLGASINDVIPDPYPEIYEHVAVLPYNDHGWYPHGPRFERLIKEHKVKNVLEVGSWLGSSTRHLATLVPENGKVFAVDHWQGSEEHLQMDVRDWLPTLYQQFLSNVIHAGLTDKIVPIRMTSLEAAKKLQEADLHIDLVYIDGAHDYISVYNDLCAWYPYIAEEGIMTGDDWHYGDVQQAVTRFAEENHLKIVFDNNFWMFERE
jgi:predicted O-methyltransferase YrrM